MAKKCSNEHFNMWYKTYKINIIELWNIFNESMEHTIKEPIWCEYKDFVDFVYCHSSGL